MLKFLEQKLESTQLETPEAISLTVASIQTIALLGLLILILYTPPSGFSNVALLILAAILFFVLSFLLIRFIVELFVYRKVLLIYKTIHELKTDSQMEEKIAKNTNLKMATNEVSQWAEERSREISGLKERERFRREFLGNISHELKTPIFSIQGYLLTLIDGGLDDPNINEKYLKRAAKSVDRMINLLKDLEFISQLESGRLNLKPDEYDILNQVQDIFDQLEDKASERGVKLKFRKTYDKPIRVIADTKKMEQVLYNLIVNSIKYSREKNGFVEVSFFDMHNNVLIEITDNGLGIPQDDLPRIFERFYRVDKSRARDAGGSGLGLAIVKHIVEAHKQTINVRSSEGVGSAFSLTVKKAQ